MPQLTSYRDRGDAGRRLAQELRKQLPERDDGLVLALPRGGVPVGYEVARDLELPLDVIIVRKLGLPSQPELAMGAIASGGLRVVNDDVVRAAGVDEETLDEVERRERIELERRETAYRGDRPVPVLEGRTVLLVDDGVATGSTILAAIAAVRTQRPRRVVVAVPVASPEIADRLGEEADEVVCPFLPKRLVAIGIWYQEFPQLTDEKVREILRRAWRQEERRSPPEKEGVDRASTSGTSPG